MNINNLVEVVNMYQSKESVNCYTDFLVLYKSEFRARAIEVSNELRERGYIVETDSYDQDIRGHLDSANFRNTREIVDICGDIIKVVNVIKKRCDKGEFKPIYDQCRTRISCAFNTLNYALNLVIRNKQFQKENLWFST